MGIVYAARDERLGRSVAIKMIRDVVDDTSRERLFREARAAASLSHPNICSLFDIGDTEGGMPYLVMELLDGESLAHRLQRGPLSLSEAAQTTLSILTALDALHARGYIHRDLKPSNVFLTPHGVKILDFGLVRETMASGYSADSTTVKGMPLTHAGMVVGTPHYMAPEQINGQQLDARADLFAVGALFYQMLTGRPPFEHENPMLLFHSIVYDPAPNLAGSTAIAAANRIIHRAMAKRPDERYASAAAMAKDLRDILLMADADSPVRATKITRLIALPLRILRPDPETDFLAFALPEAITATLAGIGALVVRSSAVAARLAELDPRQIAEEADVDVALTGTLMRAGDQIRVSSQLVELPSGAVIWSQSSQARTDDLFEMQDRLTQRIVESLHLPLTERESRLVKRDVPATPRAHEFYLRATQQPETPEGWHVARDLYLRALEEDPRYAPAWARLARTYLLLGKYGDDVRQQYDLAESAAHHALELNPELAVAHHAFAHIAVTRGNSEEAMTRLLDSIARGSNDPVVFAGLVTVLRFCGLLEASAAAHEQARQLDPNVSTSAAHTYWMLGRHEEALTAVDPDRDMGDAAFIYESMGRRQDAIEVYHDRKRRISGSSSAESLMRFFETFLKVLEGRADEAIPLLEELSDFPDPEGIYYIARGLAHLGSHDTAIRQIDLSVSRGFFCSPFFRIDPWLDPLRGDSRFAEVVRKAEARTRKARQTFEEHPGSRVLRVG